MASGLNKFIAKSTPNEIGKNLPEHFVRHTPKEMGLFNPVMAGEQRRRTFMLNERDAKASIGTEKTGLTDEAVQNQGLTSMMQRLRKFQTVFAGETGSSQSSKLGLTGRL